jgi:hypothetical protein
MAGYAEIVWTKTRMNSSKPATSQNNEPWPLQ